MTGKDPLFDGKSDKSQQTNRKFRRTDLIAKSQYIINGFSHNSFTFANS